MVGDGLEKDFVGRIEVVGMQLEGDRVGDEFSELFVFGAEVTRGFGEIERETHNRRR